MLESAKCKSAVRCRRHCARISKRPQRILSALLLVDCGRQQGRGGGGMEGGMRGKGQGKSSTDCLSIAADGVPKPTTGANIIASNIIHYRCQRCLPGGCLRPALSTLDYTSPLPPCFPYCTSSLHSVSGQQFAPMLQVGDIATDTSRSLARCLKLCIVSSSLLLCRSLLKKKSMKLQGDIPCPPPPALAMARSSLCRL